MPTDQLTAKIEAILFAAGRAVETKTLLAVLQVEEAELLAALGVLMEKYSSDSSGINIVQIQESYQMCAKPSMNPTIAQVVAVPEDYSLSDSMYETLAIVAYKQPVTKAQIAAIRGVNSDYCVNRLTELSLIQEKGRLDAPGRPLLFGTTKEFLKVFGCADLDSLPTVELPDALSAVADEKLSLKIAIPFTPTDHAQDDEDDATQLVFEL